MKSQEEIEKETQEVIVFVNELFKANYVKLAYDTWGQYKNKLASRDK